MEELRKLKDICFKATPGPWGPYRANVPFYAEVNKPSPSLSKHDHERPSYWRIEDAIFIAAASENMLPLINKIESLVSALIASHKRAETWKRVAKKYRKAYNRELE